jgi:hypothetical protein
MRLLLTVSYPALYHSCYFFLQAPRRSFFAVVTGEKFYLGAVTRGLGGKHNEGKALSKEQLTLSVFQNIFHSHQYISKRLSGFTENSCLRNEYAPDNSIGSRYPDFFSDFGAARQHLEHADIL